MNAKSLIAAAMFTSGLAPASSSIARDHSTELEKRAAAIRATRAEMSYVKIPWEKDLFEGFRIAKKEKRPVLLYMITGDPLDDC